MALKSTKMNKQDEKVTTFLETYQLSTPVLTFKPNKALISHIF